MRWSGGNYTHQYGIGSAKITKTIKEKLWDDSVDQTLSLAK